MHPPKDQMWGYTIYGDALSRVTPGIKTESKEILIHSCLFCDQENHVKVIQSNIISL